MPIAHRVWHSLSGGRGIVLLAIPSPRTAIGAPLASFTPLDGAV